MRILFIALLSGLMFNPALHSQEDESPSRGQMKERFAYLQKETQLPEEEVKIFLRLERQFREEFREKRQSMRSHWKSGEVSSMSDDALSQRLERGIALEREMLELREANIRQAVDKLGIRSYSLLRDASMRFRMEKSDMYRKRGKPNRD